MPEDACIWDRLPGLNPEMSLEQHRAARIEPYETLSGPPKPRGLADPEGFRDDLRFRLASWNELLLDRSNANVRHDDHEWIDHPFSATRNALYLIVWVVAFWDLAIGMTLAAATVTIAVHLWRSSKRSFLTRALKRQFCPDCKYDLRGCDPGLAPDLLLGLNIGPKRCPECGSHWPLLPPHPYRSQSKQNPV